VNIGYRLHAIYPAVADTSVRDYRAAFSGAAEGVCRVLQRAALTGHRVAPWRRQ